MPPHKSHHRRSKERDSSSSSARELVRLLIYEEREAQDLQRVLLNLSEQLKVEKHRADDAELRAKETTTRFKTLNDARLSAVQETAKANEELRLYKLQLETAQREIFRAQDVLKVVDAQRHSAELDAAKSRTTARKLQHERAVEQAKEEGRRMGFHQGIERGKILAFQQARYGPPVGRLYSHEDVYQPGLLAPDEDFVDPSVPLPDTVPARESETGTLVTPTLAPTAGLSQAVQTDDHAPSVVVHNTLVSMPPDGFIPETGDDSVIHLPSPHELAPSLPTPHRSPSPPLPPIPEGEEPALMIPEPPSSRQSPTFAPPGTARTQSSPESNSTTISQLDIVGRPADYVPRNVRGSPLSVITEVLSTQASPYRSASLNGSSSKLPQTTTPRASAADIEDHARRQGHYHRPRELWDSSDSSDISLHLSAKKHPAERRGSHSTTSTVPGITIQPPSRPQSNASGNTTANTPLMGEFLSPADADRPMPLPTTNPTTDPLPNTSSTVPIVLPNDQLPPGFVPSTNGFTPPPPVLAQVAPPGSAFAASSTPYVHEPAGKKRHRTPARPPPMHGPADSDDEGSSGGSGLGARAPARVRPARKRASCSVGPGAGRGYMYAASEGGRAGRDTRGVVFPSGVLVGG